MRSHACDRGRSTRVPASRPHPGSRITRVCARTWRRRGAADVRRVRRALRARDADPGARRARGGRALAAFRRLARTEGILPALEPSHALARVAELDEELVLVCLSGRGDKDLAEVADQ